jgi:hypothetical protein
VYACLILFYNTQLKVPDETEC